MTTSYLRRSYHFGCARYYRVSFCQLKLVLSRSGRSIAAAVRKATSADSNLHGAIVLLLDFAKAYDTQQRPFLLSALTLLGFSSKFVSVAAALHRDTTCRFILNGYHSSRCQAHCGIRQGCPLSPLLFILALDRVTFVGYLSHLGGEPRTSKFRAMLTTQRYTFVIDRQFCLLSRFSMILLLFQVCRRIERSLSSSSLTLAEPSCLWTHVDSIYSLQQGPADILAYL